MDAARFLDAYAAGQDFQVPESLAGRYSLVSCLKDAPSGQVYLLTGADDRLYILRVGPREAFDRFLREHLTLRQLHDPAFPHPVACFQDGNAAYLIREYIPGTPLSEFVENGDPLAPKRAVQYARAICSILEKLHALDPPVIHRDIKPHNIMRTPEGQLRLVDLDAAAQYRPESWLDTAVLGTAATAAPEQFGYQRCDVRTDIYGVGMLLVFLMTGGYDLRDFLRIRMRNAPKRIVRKCARFDPEMRYPSMARLSCALGRWQRRRWLLIAVLALTLILALGTVGIWSNKEAILRTIAHGAIAATSAEYVFASPLVERAVRLQLNRPNGTIRKADLADVEKLFICGNEVYKNASDLWVHGDEIELLGNSYEGYGFLEDLTDFRYMPNLNEVGLARLGLTDLSPLGSLHLERLVAPGNQIYNLNAIARIDGIIDLDLCDNPLSSLDGIDAMDELRQLRIDATQVTDLSPLIGMRLEELHDELMPDAVDASALLQMTSLRIFVGRAVSAEQLACLAQMPQLEQLSIPYSNLKDLSALQNLENLTLLQVSGNKIGTLAEMAYFPKLDTIYADDCGLTSITGIESLAKLSKLSISDNPNVADLSPLLSVKSLTQLVMMHQLEQRLPRPEAELPFEIIWGD